MKGYLTLLLGVVLVGCVPNEGPNYRISETQLIFPDATERWSYFYGDPQTVVLTSGQDRRSLPLLTYEGSVTGIPWAARGALWPDNTPLLRETSPAIKGAAAASLVRAFPSQRLVLQTNQSILGAWYFDGTRWSKIANNLAGNRQLVVEPQQQNPDFYRLSAAESEIMLGEILSRRGGRETVLFELDSAPLRRLTLDPSPYSYATSTLLVQYGIPSEIIQQLPVPLEAKLLQQGVTAAYATRDPLALLSVAPASYNRLWEQISATQVPRPTAPPTDFAKNSYAAFFWGLKASGGYSVKLARSEQVGSEWRIYLNLTSPAPGSVNTMAITSPYIFLELPTRATRVSFFDSSGKLLAQANAQ